MARLLLIQSTRWSAPQCVCLGCIELQPIWLHPRRNIRDTSSWHVILKSTNSRSHTPECRQHTDTSGGSYSAPHWAEKASVQERRDSEIAAVQRMRTEDVGQNPQHHSLNGVIDTVCRSIVSLTSACTDWGGNLSADERQHVPVSSTLRQYRQIGYRFVYDLGSAGSRLVS